MSEIATFKHRVVLLPVSVSCPPEAKYDDNITYECIRGIWRIAENRLGKIEYALGVSKRKIIGVFSPVKWHCALETKYSDRNLPLRNVAMRSSFRPEDYEPLPKNWEIRREFTGDIPPQRILDIYRDKEVDKDFPQWHQGAIYRGDWEK